MANQKVKVTVHCDHFGCKQAIVLECGLTRVSHEDSRFVIEDGSFPVGSGWTSSHGMDLCSIHSRGDL